MRLIAGRLLWAVACVLVLAADLSAEELVVFKHDQFPDDIAEAAGQISGIPLAVQPGFVAGEAFGQVYSPAPNQYPIKIQGVDLVVAAPPKGGTGEADASLEIYLHDSATADPGVGPDFVLNTADVFNPQTNDLGMPLKGNTAMQFEFDWGDPEGHPKEIVSGKFTVIVRFKDQAASLSDEWGSFQCTQMPELGMCGCQQVGALLDQGTTQNANVMQIIDPPGTCTGTPGDWVYANKIGVQGDFIIRARAMAASGGPCTPDCTGKDCGDDGCDGWCGDCEDGTSCVAGKCKACEKSCTGKDCGDDGCGGQCGECAEGETCTAGKCVSDTCDPVANCAGKDCGDDGCGGVCGVCGEKEQCVKGQCQGEACDPIANCGQKECGDDGCGGVCGICGEGEECVQGICQEPAMPGDLMITKMDPSEGFEDEETPVSIIGKGFQKGVTAKLGGTTLNGIDQVTSELIDARVPASLNPGTYMLIVVNPDETSVTLDNAFTVKAREAVVPDEDDGGGCNSSGSACLPAVLLLAMALLLAGLRRVRS
jgi:hypothetical protein